MNKIRIAILDDHQAIIDGYIYRLSPVDEIDIAFTCRYGEDFSAALEQHPVDVVMLDVQVPTSRENSNPYPILYLIPEILKKYPDLSVLVISMYAQKTLIHSVMKAGSSGYILKEDQKAIQELPSVIRTVHSGGIYFSEKAHSELRKRGRSDEYNFPLTKRQIETLSMCASHPQWTTNDIAKRMNIANSTVRNILSSTYLKLQVNNRASAISKAKEIGLFSPGYGEDKLELMENPE